ncbi:MAG: aminoacyl-tRNA deacylase [Myxococcaceae bacterium]|nr:aminoacyl-tRNA deacylase [Myxococcaceae bacterium]
MPREGKQAGTETPATGFLRAHRVVYAEHVYPYVEKGGTAASSAALGVDEHAVVKTLVMEDEEKAPWLVLMHGDLQVSLKALARALGKKRVEPCKPEVAQRHTGYLVGGTSPFGTRKRLPVCCEETIGALPKLYINGGKRGFLVSLTPAELVRVLQPRLVRCGQP